MTMTNIDVAKPGPLMAGKRGLIMGVANERSIAWGIARVLAGQGAKLAFTYQGDAFGRRAIPLAKSVGSEIIVNCDVVDLNSVDNVFAEIKNKWGGLDFVVHALAFSDRRELSGRYADTTRDTADGLKINRGSIVMGSHAATAKIMHEGKQYVIEVVHKCPGRD